MSTRTYDRNTIEWEQAILDALVAEGDAKAFPTPQGVNYVVKIAGQGSFAVRPGQIRVEAPVVSDEVYQESLDYLRAQIVDHDTDVDYRKALQKEADELGISVDELTDGEYTVEDGIVVSVEDHYRRQDELLAKFL